jgi:hypothetical protein
MDVKTTEKTHKLEANSPDQSPQRWTSRSSGAANNFAGAALPQSAGNLAMQRLLSSGAIRAKLNLSQPADPDEQEADRVAAQVVSSQPAGTVRGKCDACASGAPCTSCEREQTVQRQAESGHTPQVDSTSSVQSLNTQSGGQPLTDSARAFFEPRFGHNFSDVRVHSYPEMHAANHRLGARAFTFGRDIAFAAGQYAPDTASGKELLAHELTHVVQQRDRHVDEPIVHRQASGEPRQTPPPAIPIQVEYVAYNLQEEEEERSSILPAMSTAMPQALGYWTNPPGSSLSDFFLPAWLRRRNFSEPLGQQPNGDWLLERYAGRTSYNPRSPQTSSRATEFFGFDLRKELSPRSFMRSEQGGSFASYTKMTPEEIASIPDILRRVNSNGKLSFTEAERGLLYRAASAHGDSGMTGGSPFLSTTSKPGLSTAFESTPKKFLSGRPYVVRVRVPPSAVLEMNATPGRLETLVAEQEMLVTADLRGRIVAVQPNPTSSLARGEPFMRWGGRALLLLGLGMSAHRIATASDEDRGVVTMQEVATQTGGVLGAGLVSSGCVVAGAASGGVVLFVCGLVGAFLGAETANTLVTAPLIYADFLANELPYMALQAAEALEMAGRIPGSLTDSVAGGPVRAHALMDPGNWDMRYFSPEIAPDVAAVGIAMWERLGPLPVDEFISEVSKPVGAFGVPVASARRIAAFLSRPDKPYNANMPGLYASIGTSLPPAPADPGINILEMKPYELIQLLATQKLTFLQDPNYLGGFASRLEAQPMDELRLGLLIEQRERIAEDNWSFPGKTHEQVRALRLVGQLVWNTLKVMDEGDFAANVNRQLSTFGIPDWAFKDAARALDRLSVFGTSIADLTESERAQQAEMLTEFAGEMSEMTPEDYSFRLMENAGLVHIKDPGAESKAAIARVRDGKQPW